MKNSVKHALVLSLTVIIFAVSFDVGVYGHFGVLQDYVAIFVMVAALMGGIVWLLNFPGIDAEPEHPRE
jgi:hypothetical protein